MPSQNASTASARPAAATSGSTRSQTSVEIARAVVRVLARQGVGAEKAGADLDPGASAPSVARDREHLELGVAIEAVARLDLEHGHALGAERVEAPRARSPRARPRWPCASPRRCGRCRRRRARSPRRWRPSRRCSNSPARSPANTRWVWQSISPGVSQPPRRRSPLRPRACGRSAAAPSQAIRPSGIASAPSGSPHTAAMTLGHGGEMDVAERLIPHRHGVTPQAIGAARSQPPGAPSRGSPRRLTLRVRNSRRRA